MKTAPPPTPAAELLLRLQSVAVSVLKVIIAPPIFPAESWLKVHPTSVAVPPEFPGPFERPPPSPRRVDDEPT
jgi:hypothetical protein